MALTIIEYKGKIIYYNDWRNLKNDEQFRPKIEEGDENTRQLINEGEKDILTLTDVTGSFAYDDTITLLKESAKLARPITIKSATVGLSMAKKILLNGLNMISRTDLKAFDTLEDAKNWLVED